MPNLWGREEAEGMLMCNNPENKESKCDSMGKEEFVISVDVKDKRSENEVIGKSKVLQPFDISINEQEIGTWFFEEPVIYCDPQKGSCYRINIKAKNKETQDIDDFYIIISYDDIKEDACTILKKKVTEMIRIIVSYKNTDEFDRNDTMVGRIKHIK
ncbi:MAG: hypothetical protein J6A02_03225 [Prevotella sp.]|nr:hypothetical protein [Prevotella sp.]